MLLTIILIKNDTYWVVKLSKKMLVCNCRGINEKQVAVAVKAGATHWVDVHTYFGTKPSCGKCSCEIQQAITDNYFQREKVGSKSVFSGGIVPATA